MKHSQDIGKRERLERAAARSIKTQRYREMIRQAEQEGNAAIANGLVLKARPKFRLADELRRKMDQCTREK